MKSLPEEGLKSPFLPPGGKEGIRLDGGPGTNLPKLLPIHSLPQSGFSLWGVRAFRENKQNYLLEINSKMSILGQGKLLWYLIIFPRDSLGWLRLFPFVKWEELRPHNLWSFRLRGPWQSTKDRDIIARYDDQIWGLGAMVEQRIIFNRRGSRENYLGPSIDCKVVLVDHPRRVIFSGYPIYCWKKEGDDHIDFLGESALDGFPPVCFTGGKLFIVAEREPFHVKTWCLYNRHLGSVLPNPY